VNIRNILSISRNIPRKKMLLVLIPLLVLGIFISNFAYGFANHVPAKKVVVHPTPTPSPTPSPTPTPTPRPTPTPVPTLPLIKNTRSILGIEGDLKVAYQRVPWVRLGYPTCGWGRLTGTMLKKAIDRYHMYGVRVLLTFCQGTNGSYSINKLRDAARGGPDAVQCGNEEMKQDASVAFLYSPPENFARFYDQCERAMHAIRAGIPVLLGSLDPHVSGVDYPQLYGQVDYLNQVQYAMNTVVHPHGHWNWQNQAVGLIDSWHNGYPDGSVNNLAGLYVFWAQQFGVDLNSGALGKHLWVVEGTGCFKGCGVDPYNSYQVAVSHVLSLITDVQTSMQYSIPFFYFSGEDFMDQGFYWPIGVLDMQGHAKSIRQDLPVGARVLNMICPGHRVVAVTTQEDLLGRLYTGCALPDDYLSVIWS
jgi:hypothetical protein